jgi:hypothetical protein
MPDQDDESLFERLEREALFRDPDDDDDAAELDVVQRASGEIETEAGATDLTLGGYIDKHNRPPAFEGCDSQPYTVDLDTEATDDPARPFVAFFLFIRWAATGAGIMEHVESGDVAYGATEAEARAAALELTLYDVKSELDAAIRRKQSELEE